MVKKETKKMKKVVVKSASSKYEDELLKAWIGKYDDDSKFFWYKRVFASYVERGVEKFSFNWSWWGFLAGPWFLFYRKCYLEFFLVLIAGFFLGLLGFAGILFSIAMGWIAPYLIYKKFKKLREEIESVVKNQDERISVMRSVGGYNNAAIWIYFILPIIMVIFIVLGVLISVNEKSTDRIFEQLPEKIEMQVDESKDNKSTKIKIDIKKK